MSAKSFFSNAKILHTQDTSSVLFRMRRRGLQIASAYPYMKLMTVYLGIHIY